MSKVLIIDDEKDFRDALSQRMDLRGYENVALESGVNAAEVVRDDPGIDVVILDLKMPDIDGEEVLEKLKQVKPELQVVILSAHGTAEKAMSLAKKDAYEYVSKPADFDKLLKVVDKARSKTHLLLSKKKEPEPKGKSLKKSIILSLISIAAGVAVWFIPFPESCPPIAHAFIAFLTAVVLLWVTEAVPIGITALLVGGGLTLFGIQKASAAWTPYASPAVMFVMMIIMFGVVLNEVGIAKRILYYAIKAAGTNVIKFSLFLALVSSLMSSIFHDATITIILLFALIPVFMKMGITPANSNNLSKFFTILIPLSASAGGFGTILGGGRNPIAVEILKKVTGIEIGFLQWIGIQMPLVIVSSLIVWVVCFIFMNPKTKELPVSAGAEKPGPMSRNEKGVAIIFLLAIAFWSLSDLTQLHYSVIAALALIAICGLGFVSFKTIIDKFAWEAWLVFGAGVSLGAAMLDTGTGKWLADQFIPVLEGAGQFGSLYSLGLFGSVVSSFMSNSAAVALSLPIILPMADSLALSAEQLALMMPVTTSFIILVIGCPPTIIAYSTGYFSQVDFIRVALPNTLILLFVITVAIMLYWPLIGFN